MAVGVVPWPRPLARAGGPFAGLVAWWLVLVCPCSLRGPYGRRVAGAGVVLIGCAWSLPAVAVWTAPAAAVAVAGASIKRARRVVALGGPLVALRWWRGQIVKERARLALLALSRCCGGRGGSRTRAAVVARSNGHGLGPCGPWWLVLYIGVVLLEGYKARGGAFG